MSDSPFPILIIVIPLITAFLIIVAGSFRKSFCYPLMVISLSTVALSSLAILSDVLSHGTLHYRLGNRAPPWGIEYAIDHLNGFVAFIVSVISLLIGISSKRMVEREFP
ncbi:MAG: monovalent cation/H+ antiporter subunit D family protein, partial [Deltaproteobacteria bacterium]|nr:monovalent cation/H+ antiporter subunit D family protein [Deltaproteobacteria bacterium]